MDTASDEHMLAVDYSAYFKHMGMAEPDYAKATAAYEAYRLDDATREAIASEIRYAPDINMTWDENNLDSVVPALSEKYG